LSVGGRMVWDARDRAAQSLCARLPQSVRAAITLAENLDTVLFDAVLHHGDELSLRELQTQMARREGPIVSIISLRSGDTDIPLERLVIERSLSVNTAAAGGNASLMTMA